MGPGGLRLHLHFHLHLHLNDASELPIQTFTREPELRCTLPPTTTACTILSQHSILFHLHRTCQSSISLRPSPPLARIPRHPRYIERGATLNERECRRRAHSEFRKRRGRHISQNGQWVGRLLNYLTLQVVDISNTNSTQAPCAPSFRLLQEYAAAQQAGHIECFCRLLVER